jgi:APA family basic amino acid/polyamine antiporter
VPAFGIIASTVLASVFMIMSYAGAVGITVFNTLVYMSGITAAIPYAFSALAQIKWRLVDHRELQTPRFVRDVGIAVVGLVFSVLFIWYSRNTGEDTFIKEYLPFIFAGGAFLAGIPIYLKHRTSMSEPTPVPAWRP